MWRTIKNDLVVLRGGQPGRRFRDYASLHGKQRSGMARFFNLVVGASMCVFGLAIGWMPGPGGFLAVIGLAILAKEIPFIAVWLDKLEIVARYAFAWLKNLFWS